MEADDTGYGVGQCRRNLGIASVCHVLFAVDRIAMDLRVKRIAHVRDLARKFDYRAARSHFDIREALRGQPLPHGLNDSVRRAELFAELIRRQPSVIVRGGFVLLFFEKLLKSSFLLWAALQEHQNPL